MLDENLLQERLANFNPEPLIKYKSTKNQEEIESKTIKEDENTIDLAKTNFLDVLNNQDIKKSCEDIIRKYGVGTCGPRAFFGTTDVHLELEQKIAKWLGMQQAIVYSYGFVAISSSIAAYCKKSDTVFVDKHVNMGILQGIQAARSNIVHFDHNDPKSLKEQVEKVVQSEKNKKKSCRKFLIVEGVSWHTGKLLPLPEFLEVAEAYKMRIFLEESYSIGVYGETGRGLTEHFDIDPYRFSANMAAELDPSVLNRKPMEGLFVGGGGPIYILSHRLDMIIATLETAIGSIGGFCAGSHLAIEHQELSGSGYIFSASLPTYLCQACIKSIEIIGDKPKKLQKLAENFHEFLVGRKFEVSSDSMCAFKVFYAKNASGELKNIEFHEFCKEKGVHFIIESDNRMIVNLNVALVDDLTKYEKIQNVFEQAIISIQ